MPFGPSRPRSSRNSARGGDPGGLARLPGVPAAVPGDSGDTPLRAGVELRRFLRLRVEPLWPRPDGQLLGQPDFPGEIRGLHGVLKPGGELVVDVYEDSEAPSSGAILNPQAWLWEPLLKRIPRRLLLAGIRTQIRIFLPFDTAVLRRIERGGAAGRLLRYARMSFPMISNHSLQFPFLTDRYRRLWAEMNTFDRYSPKYTQAQTRSRMRAWAEELRLEGIEIFREAGRGDGTELVLRGTRRASATQ